MNKKLYKSPDKKISGVCAGIADYFNIDPTLIRLGALLLTFVSLGTAVVVYLIMSIAIENPPMNYYDLYQNTAKKLTKGNDKKISGVCSGLAQRMNIDPAIIRIAWGLITAFTVGLPGIILYIVAAMIMPEPDTTVL